MSCSKPLRPVNGSEQRRIQAQLGRIETAVQGLNVRVGAVETRVERVEQRVERVETAMSTGGLTGASTHVAEPAVKDKSKRSPTPEKAELIRHVAEILDTNTTAGYRLTLRSVYYWLVAATSSPTTNRPTAGSHFRGFDRRSVV